MTEPSRAVFLSYASQDAAAAQRICEALRAAGIQVFLDQSELRGGDSWDQKIRHEIHDCALFIPIVSQHTQERLEGYFRHEWMLATERRHHMAEQKAFLVPVVIDSTSDRDAIVPDLFRAVQWTRLPGGETPPAFVERVQRLLSPEASIVPATSAASGPVPLKTHAPASRWTKRALPIAVGVLIVGATGYIGIDKLWISKRVASAPTVAASAASTAFAPPPHSIAVLPFVNMSGDKEQEYFSDGLSEELLNSLARINELQVAARTSSFYFKGEHVDLSTVAHRLNVASVLEGSVRRSGQTIRITAQLNNAVTGFHLWSQTYDRDLKDVLQLQTEIANEVANALRVTLLGGEAAKIEVGGTRNPAAFDTYLRASKIYSSYHSAKDIQAAVAAYSDAIRLDPDYALAYAARSLALAKFAEWATTNASVRVSLDNAQADARKAIALAPNLADGHLALATVYSHLLDFGPADLEYGRALALNPGNARIMGERGEFAVLMGRRDLGLTLLRRATELDPLNISAHGSLGVSLLLLGRYTEAIRAFRDAQTLVSDRPRLTGLIGIAYYELGDLQAARSSCESGTEDDANILVCLAITYHRLGRETDAEAALSRLRARAGDSGAADYSTVYAQWGDTDRALAWLETAMRLRDPALQMVKISPAFDPLRKEPRFQAIVRELKFPD